MHSRARLTCTTPWHVARRRMSWLSLSLSFSPSLSLSSRQQDHRSLARAAAAGTRAAAAGVRALRVATAGVRGAAKKPYDDLIHAGYALRLPISLCY